MTHVFLGVLRTDYLQQSPLVTLPRSPLQVGSSLHLPAPMNAGCSRLQSLRRTDLDSQEPQDKSGLTGDSQAVPPTVASCSQQITDVSHLHDFLYDGSIPLQNSSWDQSKNKSPAKKTSFLSLFSFALFLLLSVSFFLKYTPSRSHLHKNHPCLRLHC